MATELQTPIAISGPVLTHEVFAHVHNPAEGWIYSTRMLGWLDGGVFVEHGESSRTVRIEGADYDAVVNAGSAPGRFWPEDVVAKHREILAR